MRYGPPHPNLYSLGTIERRRLCYALSRATGECNSVQNPRSRPQPVLQDMHGSITTEPWYDDICSEANLLYVKIGKVYRGPSA